MGRIAISRALAVLCLIPVSLFCQEYSFRTFGNNEGLTNLAVRQIYEDRAGFLWVSTENGIFRYDGDRFEPFGPAQGIPLTSGAALGEAPDGTLLAGGTFGLYGLRGNRFQKLNVPFQAVSWSQGIQSDKKQHTFLGTDLGLVELFPQLGEQGFGWRVFPRVPGTAGPEVDGILLDGDVVWYGCGVQLCRTDPATTRIFGKANGLPEHPIMTIRKDGGGDLWVRARNAGVFVLRAGGSQFHPARTPVPFSALGAPNVDSDGRVLLPSPAGLLVGDESGWQIINRASGLRGTVYASFEDRQHSLWIGSAGRGLARWRGYREWVSYSSLSGLGSDIVYEIRPEAKTLWVGTEGGLFRGDRKSSAIHWSKVKGLDGFPVHSVRSGPDGDLWIGTETHGAARFSPATGRIDWFSDSQGLTGRAPYTLRFDGQKRLWAATEGGLFVAAPPYQSFFRVMELPATRFWAIAEGSDGTVWAGGADGLFFYSAQGWKNFSREHDLSNQEVLALGADRNGAIWIGYRYGGGIDRLDPLPRDSWAVRKGVQRAGSDGLVYFLESDPSGRVWAGTERGVDMWDGVRWRHYDSGDGLAWDDCNLNAFAAEPDGTVWIGTSGGLSRFQIRPRPSLEAPLRVVFTKLIMGRSDVTGVRTPVSRIPENSLIARYSALNGPPGNGTLFRYRLGGARSTWTETTQRELYFAELAAGNYHLEVEAQDGNGLWEGFSASFDFRILPPWYWSWWFISTCSLLVLFTAMAIFRLRIRNLRRRERELEQLKVANDEIRNLAFFDPLTGLPNRRLLLDRLRQTLAAGVRSNRKQALLFIDLDDFKTLNDTLGHHVGDLLLQEVARRITGRVRETDTVARLGGDEFVVMLHDLSDTTEEAASQAKKVAEKILHAVNQPYLLSGRECRSSSSVGITLFGNPQDSTNEVLQQADIAMYQAKAEGRNTMRFFAPALQAAVTARAAMEEDLRQAIQRKQFTVYYQPQVDRGLLVGAEALVRWKHSERGLLSPGAFITLAEETGLIVPLGDWVLETACYEIPSLADASASGTLAVAVNISARQLRNPDFVERVLDTIARTRANPHNLKLELTESMLVDDVEDVIGKMGLLKAHGVQFSLDDFGTGYSSLAYLRRLPLDQLKIDQAFVRDILVDTGSGAIAQSIVSLGQAMGLAVIAEGVETEAQRDFLARLGCHAYQGYLFGGPVPLEEFQKLVAGAAKTSLADLR